jgi:hypothetical protein
MEAPIVLDGEHFGIQVYGQAHSTRIQWWGEGPASWLDFTAAVARLRDDMARLFT